MQFLNKLRLANKLKAVIVKQLNKHIKKGIREAMIENFRYKGILKKENLAKYR